MATIAAGSPKFSMQEAFQQQVYPTGLCKTISRFHAEVFCGDCTINLVNHRAS